MGERPREAKVNQAAVNYHFGSKAGLIEKVIECWADSLNRQRAERLEAVPQDAARRGCRPRVKIEKPNEAQKLNGAKDYYKSLWDQNRKAKPPGGSTGNRRR